jgi:predicted Zn-dependent protease
MLDLLRAAVNSHFDYDIASQYGTQLLSELIDTKFSRDQERQSDYLGVIWALESDFSPYGAVSLHTRFLNYKGDKGITFLSSHPSSEERIRTLTETAERLTVKDESDINSQRSN